ncbi:MAG: insulinase family protein [Chitinophagales bacterium]
MKKNISFLILFMFILLNNSSYAHTGNKNKNKPDTSKLKISQVIDYLKNNSTLTDEKAKEINQFLKNETPLPLNPLVRYGKLANGLTYYIQKNTKPENRVELRLAVNAGSNQEDSTQKGLAHFVEHMAFNGSKHFSKNDLVNYLESIGTKFGAHLNAYTSFDETVYMLQLPTDKKEILDKGLLVLEDWAGGLTFDTTEINKERGVVFSEWRSGLGASQRMRDKYLPKLFYNSRYAERLPIGDTAIILHAPYERLISFYKTWYRPDLMSVIVVGDINVDSMEMEIKQRFSKLKNPTNEKPKIVYTLPEHKNTIISICTDPEAMYSQVMLMYKHPAENENSIKGYRNYLLNNLFNSMLNDRLQEYTLKPEPPFIAAYSGYDRITRANDAYSLTAITKSDQTVDALKVLLTENERLLKFGFTESELARQKTALLTSYENAFSEKDKTESSNFASEYVSNFLEDISAPGIEKELALAKEILPTITLQEINNLPKQFITDDNCVIVLTAPEKEKKFLPWENNIKDIIAKIKQDTILPYTDKTSDQPLVAEHLKGSPVVKETKNEKYDITTLELKNGVRILLKPTTFKNDEILMSAYSNGGTSLYDDSDFMSADYSNSIVDNAGIADFDLVTLQKMLTGKSVSVSPYVGELSEGFNGNSTQKDVETMLQLTYLYFTNPRKSLEDFNSFMTKQKAIAENMNANPNYYFADKFQNIIYQNNIRRGLTTIEKLNKIDFEKAYKIYQERFSNAADFTFIFVGNFDIEKLKPLLETYLGSIPSTENKETWKDPNITKASGVVHSLIKMGETQKDLVGIHFHGQTTWTDDNDYIFNSMLKALNIKLREALREDKGGVYGVSVRGAFVERPKNAYGISIQFNTEPTREKELTQLVYQTLDTLKEKGVSEEIIKKVQETQRRERETDLKENNFWLSTIQYYDQYNKNIADMENYSKQIDNLNAQALKEAFNKYFDMKNYIEVVLEPEKKE